MTKQATVTKFKDYIANIKPSDSVAVIHHTDADGICSAFIVAEALERLGHKPVLVDPRANNALNAGLIKKLKKYNVSKTICIDLMIDLRTDIIDQISSFSDFLIIDHHPLYADIQTKNVIMIKQTHLGINKYYPASKLAYDLFSEVVDILDLDWVAASGLVGDFGHPQNMPFVNSILKKYNFPKKKNMFETGLGKIAIYVNATRSVTPHKIHLAMKVLKKAKKPRDVLSSELGKIAEKITIEINKQIEKFKKNAEVHGDLMISPLKSKYKITGAFMTKLSAEYFPTKTLFCYQKSATGYHVSARRHDKKVAVNDLLEQAIKGLKDAMSGGHVPAAGASIRKEDEDIFKKRLIKIHESMVAA